MQGRDDTEHLGAISGDENDKEDEVDAHVAGADDDEAKEAQDADDDVEAGSDVDAGVEAASDAADDVGSDAPAAGPDTDGDLDVMEDAADEEADEEVDAGPADDRRANLVVAASLLLEAIVTVAATIYAPPPPVTHSALGQGLHITLPAGDLTFSTMHNFPRGGTAIAHGNNKEWNGYNPSSVNIQVGVGPEDYNNRLQSSVLIRRFLSVVFMPFVHMFYFWHVFGVLDLVLLPLVWVLMGIILYHG